MLVVLQLPFNVVDMHLKFLTPILFIWRNNMVDVKDMMDHDTMLDSIE
jgi:hypothetical protein